MNVLTAILEGIARPFKWWVVIAPWELALRVRLGRSAKVLGPGVHLKLPFLDRIFVQSVRLKTINQVNINCTTKDGKNVIINVGIDFAIVDIEKLYDSLSTPDATICQRAVRAIVWRVKEVDYGELTIGDIEGTALRELSSKGGDWGIGHLNAKVSGFVACRTYRILNNDYRACSTLDDLEGSSGERK